MYNINKNNDTNKNNSKNVNIIDNINQNQFSTADPLIVDVYNNDCTYSENEIKILFVENENENQGKNLIIIIGFEL